MQLSELGERICILGPSNSGKSTLAEAIARKRGFPVIHLDQLHHLPNTNWKPRPAAEFHALHDEAIAADRWVIDGNYSRLFPQRFQRATGIILLDISTPASLFRYIRRTLFEPRRVGALAGGRDSIKLSMLHYIAIVTPGNRKRYADIFRQLTLPKVHLYPSAQSTRATSNGTCNASRQSRRILSSRRATPHGPPRSPTPGISSNSASAPSPPESP